MKYSIFALLIACSGTRAPPIPLDEDAGADVDLDRRDPKPEIDVPIECDRVELVAGVERKIPAPCRPYDPRVDLGRPLP